MVPVLLFVYNRPEHTLNTLNALKLNEGAKDTPLFIYSDAAKSKSDFNIVENVRKICRDTTGFASVKVIERQVNFGLAKNIISAVTEEIEKSGSLIVLEDDLITSIGFLNYMNNSLSFYKNSNIFSICGYSPLLNVPKNYNYTTFISPRIGSWGWATWSEIWEKVDWDVSDFESFILDRKLRKRFELGGNDLSVMLLKQQLRKINSWAIRFNYACFRTDTKVVYPIGSLIQNMGVDGSGTHMRSTKKYKTIVVNQIDPIKFCPSNLIDSRLLKQFREIYNTSMLRRVINFYKIHKYLIFNIKSK